MTALGVMSAWITGVGVWLALTGPSVARGRGWLITMTFGMVLGIVLTALLWWITLVVRADRPTWFALAVDVAFALLAVTFAGWRWRRKRPVPNAPSSDVSSRASLLQPIGAATVITLALLLLIGVSQAVWQAGGQIPYGHWDAWMTWNIKARFLVAGEHWQGMFDPALSRSRQDYPILQPLTVARLWGWAGHTGPVGPRTVGTLGATLTLAVIMTGLYQMRSAGHALLAGMVLLSSGYFISHAASQYADTMLGMMLVTATLALLLTMRGHLLGFAGWIITGLLIGAVMTVKNEGIVQAAGLLMACGVFLVWRRGDVHGPRCIAALLIGMTVPIALLLDVKWRSSMTNDLLQHAGGRDVVAALLDLESHRTILRAWSRLMPHAVDRTATGLLMLGAVLAIALPEDRRLRIGQAAVALCPILVGLAGAYAAYLLGAQDLNMWLLQGTDRIALQLWPTLVLACVLALPHGRRKLHLDAAQ